MAGYPAQIRQSCIWAFSGQKIRYIYRATMCSWSSFICRATSRLMSVLKSSKILDDDLNHMAPRIQALYYCFNKNYLLLHITQLSREFATTANKIDVPQTVSTDHRTMLLLSIQCNHCNSPMHQVLKYWAAYNVYIKVQALIQEKLASAATATSSAPGNRENVTKSQAIKDSQCLKVDRKTTSQR